MTISRFLSALHSRAFFQTGSHGIYVNVSTGGGSYAAEPFPPEQIRAALDEVTPVTDPSVSHEWTEEDFARAEFARHMHRDGLAIRAFPHERSPWLLAWERDGRARCDDETMARAHVWVPVQETQPDEQPSFSDFLGRLSVAGSEAEEARKDAQFWRARWKDAADRADARDLAAHQWKEATREHVRRIRTMKSYAEALQGGIDQEKARAEKAEHFRDRYGEVAITAERERDDLRDQLAAQEPAVIEKTRALTASDVTNEMVKRATDAYVVQRRTDGQLGYVTPDLREAVKMALLAALTEPPTRPEGAEELEAVLSGSPLGPEAVRESLADYLATNGVRVTTEEE